MLYGSNSAPSILRYLMKQLYVQCGAMASSSTQNEKIKLPAFSGGLGLATCAYM